LKGAGLGLFARVPFAKGERIVEYKGKLRPWREAKHEDGHNGYLLRVSRTMAIDALPTKRALGRYANDARGLVRGHNLTNNAEYVVDGLRCFIEAKRNIRKGEEILVAYGPEYWKLMRRLRGRAYSLKR
jgi:hypothetical protein